MEILFADRADVFVAGNLFWYLVPDRRLIGPLAPDDHREDMSMA